MRVAIDASSAVTGGGLSYLRQILPRLAQQQNVDLGPILIRTDVIPRIDFLSRSDILLVTTSSRLGGLSRPWVRALHRIPPDVVLVPTEVSMASYQVPVVSMVRNANLRPGAMHEYSRRVQSRFVVQRRLARRSARHSAIVIAVSRYAADLAESVLETPREKVRVVYHGGPEPRSAPRSGPCHRFLFVSDLYRYKNLHRLVQALEGTDDDVSLEVAGRALEPDYYRQVQLLCESLRLRHRVRFLGHLGDSALEEAYRRADCFIWPSYAETFGQPLLEASAHGLPVAASALPVNREILGDAAAYFDPFDVNDIRTSIRRLSGGHIEPTLLPRTYSWDRCAAETAAVLREAVGIATGGAPTLSPGR